MRVLDLGAGDGTLARWFAEAGAEVTAVDLMAQPDALPERVRWVTGDVRDMALDGPAPHGPYDLVLAKNLIQFLEKDVVRGTLAPWMRRSLVPYGTVAIQSFYDDPHPPIRRRYASYWEAEELRLLFSHIWVSQLRQAEEIAPDLETRASRLFRHSSLIAVL